MTFEKSTTNLQNYETDCLKKYFGKTTNTERLIKDFLSSDKSFLLLYGFSRIHDKERGSRDIDLIAVRSEVSSAVQLSDIQILTEQYLENMKYPKQLRPLIAEISQIVEDS